MKRAELLARVLILAGCLVAICVPVYLWLHTPLVRAQMSEDGGWSPNIIEVEVGQPLHLKFISDDVVHGFAIGQVDIERITIEPGNATDVTLTFDKPGIYTYYCTRWCGLNHWRMRGTIEVSGSIIESESAPIPLYVSLNLDIDVPHEAPAAPNIQPSLARGRQLENSLDLAAISTPDFYRANSPYQAFNRLSTTSLTEAEKWDVVSFIWMSNTTPAQLANGKRLYAQNCAACHGESGAGDGVFADDMASASQISTESMSGAMSGMIQSPAAFTNSKQMLGASPALLQGKILRGGMGTGMPMWGSIFTEEQIWNLVSYLYSFQFKYKE
jgi:mono/diheme cytochrome c family protein/plastocyanin